MRILSIFATLGFCNAGFQETYDLVQDDETETYFLEAYVGSKVEKLNLLIDTQANGTAIVYDPSTCQRARVHDDIKGTVEFPGGVADGYVTEDYFCLD